MSVELLMAVMHNDLPQAKHLLETTSADPNYNGGNSTEDGSPLIALFQAIINKNKALISLLVQYRADVNQIENRHGLIPLHFVLRHWDTDTFVFLFRHGADIDQLATEEYAYELQEQSLRKRANVIWYLQHYKVFLGDIVANNVDDIRAALTQVYHALEWYDGSRFDYEIDPNFDAGIHGLPIQLAAQFSTPEIIELLVARGADVNKTSSFNPKLPLYIAIENNNYLNAMVLIKHGASIDTLSKEALSRLLDLAIINNNLVLAMELLSRQVMPLFITWSKIKAKEIDISSDMEFLLQQYDLTTAIPTLKWLTMQTIMQTPGHKEEITAMQESLEMPLIALAYKCGLKPI